MNHKEEKKHKDCPFCHLIPMGMSPEGWRNMETWHDNGHPETKMVSSDIKQYQEDIEAGVQVKEEDWEGDIYFDGKTPGLLGKTVYATSRNGNEISISFWDKETHSNKITIKSFISTKENTQRVLEEERKRILRFAVYNYHEGKRYVEIPEDWIIIKE